jgi:hypothetical protein
MVRPSITLAYYTLWCPNGRGLHSTPFKWSNDQLEYHGVFLSYTFSRLRGISTTWSLSPLQLMITKNHRSKGGESNTHMTQNKSTITHTKPQLELTTQLEEFSTQMGLKSLSQRIECARMESWCLGMIKECLGSLLHAPRGLFYGPKAARSRRRQSGKAILAFCRVAHRTGTVQCRVQIAFLKWHSRPLQSCSRWCTGHCPVHTGQSGASCRPLERATRRPRIWRPTVALATVCSMDSPVHHRTVRWIIAVRRRQIPESGQFARNQSGAPDTVRCTTGQSGAPDCAESWLLQPSLFLFLFSLILAPRQIY